MPTPSPRALVHAHIEAFNAHDTQRLLAGLTQDVVWTTGTDIIRGRAAMVDVFDDGLWRLEPHLDVRRLMVDGRVAAAECTETITIDGETRCFPIACYYTADGDLFDRVTVYREGNATID